MLTVHKHDEKVKKIKEIDQKRELAAQIKERCKKLLDKKEAQYKIKSIFLSFFTNRLTFKTRAAHTGCKGSSKSLDRKHLGY